ncbi:TPA: HicB family protein [Candidatus Uhrbacteria bacterium]|uniref:HicB-like antitoxin of toxin-antitoxin system domain-containing protein n=1 Tax=Candidatus Uhrbacteria bacterium GW2011_GWC2_53_7 TaxID=1618986 RepID=A0A0G2ARQ6_9BACT|nr:MAG: hypothetical protein UY82_C0038G0007 [Candidatus Uhrbacteria bacterium GW2011_GWC2_53_7]HBL39533.1 HicB family protein [Candidatus Uhrbacteria bacterium]
MKKLFTANRNFHVIYREEHDWFIATVPELPGCHTQGKTLHQAEQRITEAIEVYLESLVAHKETLPKKEQRVFLSSVMVGN